MTSDVGTRARYRASRSAERKGESQRLIALSRLIWQEDEALTMGDAGLNKGEVLSQW